MIISFKILNRKFIVPCGVRFWRNAGLVASGVAANLNKVGNYVKETVDDILYPYRKRPK